MNSRDTEDRRSLYQIAFIFMIVATVMTGWSLITLAYMIPMTIMLKKAMDEVGSPTEQNHLGLAICTLIFGSMVAGICAIIATTSFKPDYVNDNNDKVFTETNNGNDF